MRHHIFGRQLNRNTDERKRLFRNLTQSLILHGRITTTLAKAKAVQPFVEKLITRAKVDTLVSRRLLLKKISNEEIVNKLLSEIGPLFKKRSGGYTRITKRGSRLGDNASKVILSFTEHVTSSKVSKESKPEKGTHAKNENNQKK